MALRFKDDTLPLALCDVDLRLCVEELLAPVTLSLHLELELSLDKE
jgi:hypothetical protein